MHRNIMAAHGSDRSRKAASTHGRIGHRADIDGLRAVAVVPVVVYHLGSTLVPGGFVGVDVFFVISGFLITGNLLGDLKSDRFSLLGFYDRRIRRIVPALVLVLAFCTGAAFLTLFPADLVRFGNALTATAASASNFVFAQHTNYFAQSSSLQPLLHTWSLAVEEQFYIFFPLALWLVWRKARSWLTPIVWITLLSSLSLSAWAVWAEPKVAFYLLPARAWELLLGSALALGLLPKATALWQREVGAAVGVLAILAAMIFYTDETHFPGVAALVPCVGAALVIWAGMERPASNTWTAWLLSTPGPVFIGLISYSLYLWHWPLIVYAKHATNGIMTLSHQIALACAAVLFAFLSWRYVEMPLRAGRSPWPKPRNRFVATGVLALVFAVVGAGMQLGHGFPERMSPQALQFAATATDFSPLRHRCHTHPSDHWTLAETCVLGAPVPPKLIVYADSHGAELSLALSEVAKARNMSVREVTASGCPPAIGFTTTERPACAVYNAAVMQTLLKTPPSTIIMGAYYFDWATGVGKDRFWSGFSEAVQSLRNAGHRIIILGAVPPFPGKIPVPVALGRWVEYGGTPADFRFAVDGDVASEIEHRLRRLANATGSTYVPLEPYFCPDDRGCRGYIKGTVMYFDDNHMSISGAKRVTADLLVPVIWPEQPKPRLEADLAAPH